MIGGTLLYGGRALTEKLESDAARWGLSRDVFVEERVWIAKQQKYGAGREAEYEQVLSQRQAHRTENTRASILRLRQAYFAPAAQ